MGAPIVWRRVLQVFLDAPDQKLFKTEIAERAGLRIDQVTNAMNTLLRNAEEAQYIDVLHKNHAWRYSPNGAVHTSKGTAKRIAARVASTHTPTPAPTPVLRDATSDTRIFEEVGTLKDGGLLIRDGGGKMYRAEEL